MLVPNFLHIFFWLALLDSHFVAALLSASKMVPLSHAIVAVQFFPVGIPSSVIILFSNDFS